MAEVDYSGLNQEAVALIKLMPKTKNVKILRVGMDIKLFAGSKNVVVRDFRMNANGKRIKCRLYYPQEGKPSGLLVYFHGGGFLFGGINNADGALRDTCQSTGWAVVAVKYSLAPEHRFPNAINECYDVVRMLINEERNSGFAEGKVYLGGDSAGGNIAEVIATRIIREGGELTGLILMYPFCQLMYEGIENTYPSLEKMKSGYFLERSDIDRMTALYLPTGEDVFDELVSPLNGDQRGLPPTIMFAAGFDPIRDTYMALAEKMSAAGVEVKVVDYPDTIHGFFTIFKSYASRAIEEIKTFFEVCR